MSPVSKGRKRKPNKASSKTGRSGPAAWRPGLPVEQDPSAYTLDRRVFTMPYHSTTIHGEDFDHLDPADPDQRRLLIEGEHPEYHDALADPNSDEVDGVNPRLHVALHEIIANQLWDDDPPEAWQAARRLRDNGLDRHDILHALAAVATEHLHSALMSHEPVDTDAYRRALDDLGRAARP